VLHISKPPVAKFICLEHQRYIAAAAAAVAVF
jgi:hypothetical protein